MSEVLRTDLVDHAMNAGKERAVRDLLRAWRRCAVLVGREQWRLFFEAGRVNKMHRSPVEADLAAVAGAANRVQMLRHQVAGSWTPSSRTARTSSRGSSSARPFRVRPSTSSTS